MKPGDLIEIKWLDAAFYMDGAELSPEAIEQGGEPLHTIGVLIIQNKKSVVVCAELDEDREPHRDFNLIPRKMIVSIKILKRRHANVQA